MRPSLLYPGEPPAKANAPGGLEGDLHLGNVVARMARGDEHIAQAARRAFFEGGLPDEATLIYRQEIIKDALSGGEIYRTIYGLAKDSCRMQSEIHRKLIVSAKKSGQTLARLAEIYQLLLETLGDCRRFAAKMREYRRHFVSDGTKKFFYIFTDTLDKTALDKMEACARARYGTVAGSRFSFHAEIGPGMKSGGYMIGGALQKSELKAKKRFRIRISADRESFVTSMERLTDAAQLKVYGEFGEAIQKFRELFLSVRDELAFYAGCVNLHEKLTQFGVPVCFPSFAGIRAEAPSFAELADASLALERETRPTGNSLDLSRDRRIIITGANMGGKSTMLRSVGCALVMAHCGMFVAAKKFRTGLFDGIHSFSYEGAAPSGGAGDLLRFERALKRAGVNFMMLLNEPFSSMSETAGSARVKSALHEICERGGAAILITHFHKAAREMAAEDADGARFLTTELDSDGSPTYVITDGQPKMTGAGARIFDEIFGE